MITSHIVLYKQHGEPKDVLETHSYQIDETKIGNDQVIVKTLASPINPSDINQIQGVYPSKPKPTTEFGTTEPALVCGNEGLFEVIHTGAGVKDFQVGDWVIPALVNLGTWRTHALEDSSKFIKLRNPEQSKAAGKPQGLTYNQGATISVNPLTAYLMLTHYVKLTPGKDWFIQNGGNSAVGQYASQIGKLLGINSISVVRDRDNLQELVAELEAKGATHVITEEQNSSREYSSTIKDWVKETGGEIKLAFNCVGGKNSTGVARKLANNGLMLTYGGMSFQPVILPTSLHIFKNITSAGFWVTALLANNQELKQETLAKIVDWYEQGKLVDASSTEVKFDGEKKLSELYLSGITGKGKHLVTY
ncbi:enoyl-reductase 2 mitochondrial precursor [Suhomyces tanzawaensis NRRL Y-17324]|uniref:enoyl-[acyl-carrier-protein] reductase n=1 Tax=Suhomyces tanzawaensis NRRL Y-17324 TaxID=984487 RepID=A0A1E4SPL3_9ASCO|nr:enoyl-reductase 2 mitochondrial precursor [Suhomyces tanzawaensis NRRL Y-17324]ODV81461.1 enoyl-reductase 2 mitochondrial precursor [Suhomyces tanzawaensis NRRL Y-17324]